MEQFKQEVQDMFQDILFKFDETMTTGNLLVLGCSSSEVRGKHIGKGSSEEVGHEIVSQLLEMLKERGVHLAVQCCEHLNRGLVIEREVAQERGYEVVNAIPHLNAGGSAAVAGMKLMNNPVLVEHIVAEYGIDVGDTFIGMHVKHVQVPVRPQVKELGQAHVTALRSRPKYVGGPRAHY